jgi:hypothetical protein
VIGQDASRAMNKDNNEIIPDKRQALQFMAGDKLYINIRMASPEIIISSGVNPGGPRPFTPPTADVDYTIEITLDDGIGAAF